MSERSVSPASPRCANTDAISVCQDRETEPRFTGPPARGDFGGAPRGGFGGGGYGGGGVGQMGGGGGGGGRQLYVSNVCPSYILPFSGKENDRLTYRTASIQCRVAGSEGSLPTSW